MSFSTITTIARTEAHSRSTHLARRVVHAAWLMLTRWRERQVLASLSARELRDIGVTPYEAGIEARKPFWRA
jgi:uncharacterized protein YjiS (DUF1127 family)